MINLGAEILVCSIRTCDNPACPDQGKPLGGDHKTYAGHLFTRRRGVLPIRVVTLYCRGMHPYTLFQDIIGIVVLRK